MRTLQHFGALFFCAAGALVACSVPDVVFAPDADGGEAGVDADPTEASIADAAPTGDAGPPAPEAATPPMPMPPGCPEHPPKGAQGCCGTTPCVGAGCTMQCPACGPCAGQVCCVSGGGGGDKQKQMNASVSCAPDPASCAGSG